MLVDTFIESQRGGTTNSTKPILALLVPLLRSSSYFCLCVPRVSFRALPSLHPGLCRSVVPTALIMRLNFDASALANT